MADLNTGLSAPEVLEAFDRALHDYTNSQIDTMLAAKQAALTFDSMPTDGSTNPVRSDGIYDFVNSSVSTNTANFIGTFNSVAELEAYSGTVTNNDYAFVISTDSAGNTVYNRYKYNGSAWVFEYALNNSSFTAAQWATIQSGLTASDKTKLDGIEAGANKTVVDANLSQTSTNPVQNKIVNTALAAKQDNISDLAAIRSGAAAGATAVQPAEFEADQQRQETEIGVVANAGAKNLLSDKNPIGSTVETNGFRFTPQFDGGIKIESIDVHIANGDYYIQGNWGNTETVLDLSDNTYTASLSCETDVRIVSLRIFGANNTPVVNNVYVNNEASFTGEVKFIFISVLSTSEIPSGGVIVYPMIRPASITDSTYVPYAPTNRELYETKTDQTETTIIANLGAKNLLKMTATSQTIKGVTFTVNDDQTVTVNGQNTGSTPATFVIVPNADAVTIPDGNYILSGCPSGGGYSTYDLRWYRYSPNRGAYDMGTGAEVSKSGNTTESNIAIVVKAGQTANNVVFSPMLRPAEITDDTFVPYAPTNRELYETKADASDLHALLPNITSATTIQAYVDSLSKGVYTAFIANVSNPSDSPIDANCFVNIYVYSANTAAVELIPLASSELSRTYTMRKISGTWREWYKFEGTVVS